MDGRRHKHQGKAIDPADFQLPISTDRTGRQWYAKPGRRKKLSAAQAALIFECQVQIGAHQRLIDRTLKEAGVSVSSSCYILTNVWRDRGRIDILHKARPKQARAAPDRRPSPAKPATARAL